MSDLIDRQAAYETLTDYYHHRTDIQHTALREALNKVPSAERKGHWMKKWHTVFKEELPCCSECNNFMAFRWDYCPNCGARMDTFEGAMNPPEGE